MLIQATLMKLSGEKRDLKVGERLVRKNKGVIGSASGQENVMGGDEYGHKKLYACMKCKNKSRNQRKTSSLV